jgi:hypothetical protein
MKSSPRDAVVDSDIKYPPHTDEKLALLKSVVGMGPEVVASADRARS